MSINPASPTPIRAMIIDDDAASVEVLRQALEKYKDVEICAVATSLEEGRRQIAVSIPDILFLDIEFPEESGLDLIPELSDIPELKVVFYTCYEKYLHQALRMHAFDFLLKPFDEEELSIILTRFRMDRAGKIQNTQRIGFPVAATPSPLSLCTPDHKAIAITTITNDKVIVPPSGILFFKYHSVRKLWEVVLTNLSRHILKRHTTAEVILSYGNDFVRTHKSYIINIGFLTMISGNECHLLPPFDHITEIKISKNYRRQLLDSFYDI